MENVKINLLGRFEIIVNGVRIDQQLTKSRKSCTFIQYLILNRARAVPYQELFDILWPHEEIQNRESALKTMVSRLRVLLGGYSRALANSVSTVRGAYRWAEQPGVSTDIIEFEKLCGALRTVTALNDDTEADFKRVYDLYIGDLLPDNNSENWIVSRGVALQDLYISTVYKHLEFLSAADRPTDMISFCRVALGISAFDERLHMMLMDALVRTNRTHEAIRQYQYASGLQSRYLGAEPSANLHEFYNHIISTGHMMDDDLLAIRRELHLFSETKNAFVCEWPVFREIYNLQLRSLRRSNGINTFLALITVSSTDTTPLSGFVLDDVMNKLLDVLKECLRQSDTVCKYSPSHFVMLLPLKSYDNGKTVMERIKHAFYSKSVNSSVIIDYRISPITENL